METRSPRISTRYETGLVVLLFFTWGSVFLDRMALLYLAPYMAPDLHLNSAQIGLLAAVTAISWAVSSVVFGTLSDIIGRRKVLIPMIFVFSALSWLSGVAENFTQLLIIRALMGIAEGPCWSVIATLIEQSSSPAHKARNVGIVVSAAAAIGLAVAPILSTQIAQTMGWRSAFFVVAVPGIVLGVLNWLYIKEPKQSALSNHAHSTDGIGAVLRNWNVILSAIGAAGFMGWLFLQNAFGPLYLTKVGHLSGTEIGELFTAAGAGSFVLGLTVPTLADRYGRKLTLVCVAILSAGLPLALLYPPLYAHPWVMAGILFVTQGGQVITAILIVLVPTESVSSRYAATAVGVVTFAGEVIGGTLLPAIAGPVADQYGLQWPLIAAVACAVVVVCAAFLVREQPRTPIVTMREQISRA